VRAFLTAQVSPHRPVYLSVNQVCYDYELLLSEHDRTQKFRNILENKLKKGCEPSAMNG